MKPWLEKNAIEMYSTRNKGKPAIAKTFTRTLKNDMTSILKNMYID